MSNGKGRKRMAGLETAAERTAKSMLRRTDIKVVTSGNEACYNWKTKTLHVPAYSIREGEAKPEEINAWRGLLDHECAHVEYSDCTLLESQIEVWERRHGKRDAAKLKTLVNAFEDAWIERAWGAKNIGSAKFLEDMNRVVIRDTGMAAPCHPTYSPPGSDGMMGQFGAFSQAIMRVYSGFVSLDDIDQGIRKLMEDCRPQIEQGWTASSTAEAIEAAEAVWQRLVDIAEDAKRKRMRTRSVPLNEDAEGPPGGGTSGGEMEPEDGDTGVPCSGSGDEEGDNPESDSGAGKDEPEESDKTGGAGAGSTPAEDITGDEEWTSTGSANDVVASKFCADPSNRPYTVHPCAKQADTWDTYDAHSRKTGKRGVQLLRASAGPSIVKLANYMRCAIKSMRETLWVGGLEEGIDIDPDSLPMLAIGSNDTRIFRDKFRRLEENTYVCVLVDCSGSMGDNRCMQSQWCPTHGRVKQRGTHCSRPGCGEKLSAPLDSKAAYAAVTATVLHDALRLCAVPHSVLGYTNSWIPSDCRDETFANSDERVTVGDVTYPKYSRHSTSLRMKEFVASPGLSDDGSALAYIDGHAANLDGESVLAAAKYAAKHAGDADRVILLVVADGLPAGSDDPQLEGIHLRRSVERVCQAGIEVYGIGVGIRQRKVFQTYYPDVGPRSDRAASGSVLLGRSTGLSDTVLRQLTDLLIRSNGYSRKTGTGR